MTDLLAFLADWYRGQISSGEGDLIVRFGASEAVLPKRSPWVQVEGLHRIGQLTVWESGETELEVNDITSVELVHTESGRSGSREDLIALLAELLREVELHDGPSP